MAEKKITAKAEETKATETTAAKKTATKKAVEKTAEVAEKKPAAKKAAVKCEMQVQFAGKSYTQDDLMKIAKDVWKYDLKQKVGDLKTVELYVKPEESAVYYVMNKDYTGSFMI